MSWVRMPVAACMMAFFAFMAGPVEAQKGGTNQPSKASPSPAPAKQPASPPPKTNAGGGWGSQTKVNPPKTQPKVNPPKSQPKTDPPKGGPVAGGGWGSKTKAEAGNNPAPKMNSNYDSKAVAAARQKESKDAFDRANEAKKTAANNGGPPPTVVRSAPKSDYVTKSGETKTINSDSEEVRRLRRQLDDERYLNRRDRERDFYYTRYHVPMNASPPSYNDRYHPFLGSFLGSLSGNLAANYLFHHRGEMDSRRYDDIMAQNAHLRAEVDRLERSGTRRDPSYVPPGYENDEDMFYDDDYVGSVVNADVHHSGDGSGLWILFWIVLALGVIVILVVIVAAIVAKVSESPGYSSPFASSPSNSVLPEGDRTVFDKMFGRQQGAEARVLNPLKAKVGHNVHVELYPYNDTAWKVDSMVQMRRTLDDTSAVSVDYNCSSVKNPDRKIRIRLEPREHSVAEHHVLLLDPVMEQGFQECGTFFDDNASNPILTGPDGVTQYHRIGGLSKPWQAATVELVDRNRDGTVTEDEAKAGKYAYSDYFRSVEVRGVSKPFDEFALLERDETTGVTRVLTGKLIPFAQVRASEVA